MLKENNSHAKGSIGVIGLGFVGLPIALLFAKNGFSVTGIDLDKEKVKQLNNGVSYLPDVTNSELSHLISSRKFYADSTYESIKNVDTVIICVPTPLTTQFTPDLSYLQEAGLKLAPFLKQGCLVVLESSTYPGTTNEVLKPILEQNGLVVGEDFNLAYSPERIDPGNKFYPVEKIPKLVSGVTDSCTEHIKRIYSHVFHHVVPVSSPEVAELTKLLENSYRFINISFINEITIFCDAMNLDVWEVIEAAKTKPYGFTPFYPGPGVGGHCIPIDPLYLLWKAKQYNIDLESLTTSTRINQLIPLYIVEQLKMLLSSTGDLANKKLLILGISYKKDLGDIRETPAIPIIRSLKASGASVSYFDPYVSELTVDNHTFKSDPTFEQTLMEVDCVVILTDHSKMDIEHIIDQAKLVYDTRNITKEFNGHSNIVRLGGGGK